MSYEIDETLYNELLMYFEAFNSYQNTLSNQTFMDFDTFKMLRQLDALKPYEKAINLNNLIDKEYKTCPKCFYKVKPNNVFYEYAECSIGRFTMSCPNCHYAVTVKYQSGMHKDLGEQYERRIIEQAQVLWDEKL